MSAWRWQALGWWKGGQIPLLLAVFLGEVLFVTPLRGVSWADTVRTLPVMIPAAGGIVALLVCLARQGRAEARGFLRVLPLPGGVPARVEMGGDLAACLAWASVWPILVPTRPHVAGLWVLAHLWGCATGILAARAGGRRRALVLAALGGAAGPALAAAWGWIRSPVDWEHALWPWGAGALSLLAAAVWVPAALASLPEPEGGAAGPGWLGARLPLPWRARGLEVFLTRGNLALLAALAFAAAFAAFVGVAGRALEGLSPRLVSVLVGTGMSVPLALGLSPPVREFLLTRPLSRGRCLAAAGLLGALASLAAPAAGLLALRATTDAQIEEQVDRAVRLRLIGAGFASSREDASQAELQAVVRESLRIETGIEDLDFEHPRPRREVLAAARAWRRRGWGAAGLLGLLWFSVGIWVRMRHGSGLGSRRSEAAALLGLLIVTLPEFSELGWRAPWPACPLPLLALGVAAASVWIWRDLLALEAR